MQPGTRLEHYEIIEPIGEGGMGAVYKAEDTRLKRTVAIKVLPAELAADPERLARLEREAQLLATVSHPNVATVHGFGQETIDDEGRQRPVSFLVMELVPGPSLHERLVEGPLPWREAVDVAIRIASALEAAHDRGIVHRDLKPANVHLSDDGTVKVLDFGLAKALEGAPAGGSAELSASPTLAAATRTGTILGTASYMSPEQARGEPVDERTDVWALGCVLYEMLTGRKAFGGGTVSDVLASILKEEPDLDSLPPVPIRLRHLLERCLAKQPGQRMHDVADVRLELEAAGEESVSEVAAASTIRNTAPLLGIAAALGLLLGLAAGFFLWGWPAPSHEMRLLVSADASAVGPDPLSISPDGRWIAETSSLAGIRLRAIDDYGWRRVPETEGAISTKFSPEGHRLYFTQASPTGSDARLRSVGLDGATPTTEGEIPMGQTGPTVFHGLDGGVMVGAWNPQTRSYAIYRHEPGAGLTEVTSGSSDVFLAVTAQVATDRWLAWTFDFAASEVGLMLIGGDPSDNVAFLEGYASPRWLGDGRIIAVDAQGRLVTATIDPETGAVLEPPAIRLEGLGLASGIAGAYDVSANGTLVYIAGPADDTGVRQALAWMDLSGDTEVFTERRRIYQVDSRVSPDGERVALEVQAGEGDVSIWIHEIARDVQTALTPGLQTSFPVWSPDSQELVFRAEGDNAGIQRAPIDRSSAPELLLQESDEGFLLPMDWSPDGSLLLYVDSSSSTRARAAERNDLWLLPLDGSEPRPFLATEAREVDGRFSPDGRWIAYVSDQTGRDETWVRAVEGGGEYKISAEGGVSPEWNPAGDQLFFEREHALMVVDIDTTGATPSVSSERLLTRLPGNARPDLWHPHPDGERFLVALIGDTEVSAERSIRAILNWSPLQR